ncbi:TIGR04388 family protein [Leptospira fletcheri]|uniref:TIGR04388 family protein n=1 Tax=Leptospira fletcheri TaxID=2484981 RepID=A0A4V3JD67_9LEPT|nr:TIGR04388 family protein [Leptospira fletcheri]TGK08789.1 TIGR04388 family protein [Leptospira fletcheri]
MEIIGFTILLILITLWVELIEKILTYKTAKDRTVVKLLGGEEDLVIDDEHNNLTEGESLTRGYEDKGIIIEKKVRDAAKQLLGEFGGKSFQMPAGSFVGIDINTKTGNYTVNGGYDFNPGGENHVGMTVSASRDGSANAGAFYNYSKQDPQPEPGSKPVLGADGKPVPPPKSFMGKMGAVGAALTMSNDGTFDLAGQWKGVNVASMSYDTNTHKLGQVHGSGTFFSDFASSVAQENASNNIEKQQKQMDEPTGKLLVKMGMMSEEERLSVLETQGPGKLNEMFDTYKKNMADSGNIEQWKNQVQAAGDAIGMRVQFDEGKSAKTALESAWNRFKGDVFGSFGIANDGSKSYSAGKDEEPSVLRTKTCFDSEIEVKTPRGYQKIVTLNKHDQVYTVNEETGEIEIQKITETFVHEVHSVHNVYYDTDEKVTTTWNHPFGVIEAGERSGNSGVSGTIWVKAEDLHGGDRSITRRSIRTAETKRRLARTPVLAASLHGIQSERFEKTSDWSHEREGTLGIRRVEEENRKERVYNIELSGNHNYFIYVGEDLALVHNYAKEQTEQVSAALARTETLLKASNGDQELVNNLEGLKNLGKEFNKNALEATQETNRLQSKSFLERQKQEMSVKKCTVIVFG